ncbi:toll/interleukin-1 receptor domain-containing protein [Nocardioides kribbensis]|uniref:Toll/interleukin-1 receptor domain-containing protein n=1 Tax=Nocardioides kribbensis TaxID=305517 RepID=A0ABV1NTG0_9ACTN
MSSDTGSSGTRPPHFFISYTKKDRSRAKQFIKHLEKRGVTTWWMEGERTAEAYPREIDEAIDRATGFVLLYSRFTGDSVGCLDELTSARAAGLPIAVVKLDSAQYAPGYRNQLSTATPIDWFTPEDVADTVLSRLTGRATPELGRFERLRRWASSTPVDRWTNIGIVAMLMTLVVVVTLRFDTVQANVRRTLESVGLFDGPDAKLRGTLTIRNLTTGKDGEDGLAVVAGDNLNAVLEFENVGEDPLPPTSEITLNWDPLTIKTDIEGNYTGGSGGSIDFGMRVNGDFVTTIDGTLTGLDISDPCTAEMHVYPDDASIYLDGSDLIDRIIQPVNGDPSAARARITTTVATFPFGSLEPGHTVRAEIPIRTAATDGTATPTFQTGGVVDARIVGETGSETTLSASPGDRVEVRAAVIEQSCSEAGSTVFARAPITVDGTSSVVTVPVIARREGESDETTLGEVVVSLLDGASALKVVPGSTTVSRPAIEPEACEVGDAEPPTSWPSLDHDSPETIYDGITQGGVDIGVIQGFTPRDKCRGMTQKEAEVRFELLVK